MSKQNIDEDKKPAEETEANQEPESAEEIVEKSVEDYEAKWLRALADYQNLKKQTVSDRAEFIKYANAGLILELLPILNNFKVAADHVPPEQQEADWVKGIFHIKTQLADLLKNMGIEQIPTVGEKFDPQFHEAVGQEAVEGKAEGEIIKEVRAGYTLHGKVIDPAKVIVNK
ncbi:MAG: nucleotide exchange factor GrpE [Patescibacteria group bacterium]|jgi:molecular chaperone GrpE